LRDALMPRHWSISRSIDLSPDLFVASLIEDAIGCYGIQF
jgi:hypothetical protein